jgi:hypothetical protein
MKTELTMESAAKIMDLKIRPGEPDDLTIAQLIHQRADLLAALEKIDRIVFDGVIHRSETGKPQWSAFDEIKKIIAAAKGGI